jgi:hypothetical protein
MSMASDQAAKAFALRVGLSQAGIPWRACSPAGEYIRFATVSESGINLLISDYPEATETGIWLDGHFTVIDQVPMTPEQVEAKRIAEEEARAAAIIAEEKARQEALIEAARSQERQRKADKRRAQGKPTREQWLAARGAEPWVEAGVSRRTWFRQKKRAFSNDV